MATRYLGGARRKRHRERLIRVYGNYCLCCGVSGLEVPLTLDHIVPPPMGGSNSVVNLQLLCFACNQRKNQQIIDYRPFEYPLAA